MEDHKEAPHTLLPIIHKWAERNCGASMTSYLIINLSYNQSLKYFTPLSKTFWSFSAYMFLPTYGPRRSE